MQSQEYTLTNRLMGDPRPDRDAYSDKVKAIAKWKPTGWSAATPCPPQPVETRIIELLKAIRSGVAQSVTIAEQLGVNRSLISGYLKRARDRDLIMVAEQLNFKCGGRIYIYALTDKGRAELERAA